VVLAEEDRVRRHHDPVAQADLVELEWLGHVRVAPGAVRQRGGQEVLSAISSASSQMQSNLAPVSVE
jgi:hypothetical protein